MTQPSVPCRRDERLHVLAQLLAYGVRYPERSVAVKLRVRPGEATSHRERFSYQELFEAEFPDRRGELELLYGRMDDALSSTDLCLTVSSTAALESMARGIPTGILTDFGLGERLGNHFFAGSGAVTSFPRLLRDELPVVDVGWLRRNGFDDGDDVQNLVDRVVPLLAAPRTPPHPWYGPEATSYVCERSSCPTPRRERQGTGSAAGPSGDRASASCPDRACERTDASAPGSRADRSEHRGVDHRRAAPHASRRRANCSHRDAPRRWGTQNHGGVANLRTCDSS